MDKNVVKRFIDNNDGTITDTRTNLMWETAPKDILVTWEEAATYCYKLDLGGYKDWRMPNVWELVSTFDYQQTHPEIYVVFGNVLSTYYWTGEVSCKELGGAWVVDFSNGLVDSGNIVSKIHIRAVREIQND